jgi:hypothetical protein
MIPQIQGMSKIKMPITKKLNIFYLRERRKCKRSLRAMKIQRYKMKKSRINCSTNRHKLRAWMMISWKKRDFSKLSKTLIRLCLRLSLKP